MKKRQNLQWFLIRKFIHILLIVGIAEYAIMLLLNRFVVPVMYRFFFPGYEKNVNIGSGGVLILSVIVLPLLFLNVIRSFIPSSVSEMMLRGMESIWNKTGEVFFPTQGGAFFSMLNSSRASLFFLTILAWSVVVLLPYVIAAICFARITIREFREIQEEREAEQREFDKRRNLMLSDIAHDLRTPMTTVNGYAKALADGMVTDPEKEAEYLCMIQKKCVRMNDLINLLFEYVKLDSDGFTMDFEKLDLYELLRENAALAYPDLEEAGMEFEIDIPEEPFYVNADRVQLSRVFTNLLNNARKHNPKGTRIGIYTWEGEKDLCICFADNGSIIPNDLAEHLFDPFAKGDASRKSGTGSGLGLSIAKKVTEMHGFTLELIQYPHLEAERMAKGYTKEFVIRISRHIGT